METEDKRRDGLSVVAGIDGMVIMPADEATSDRSVPVLR